MPVILPAPVEHPFLCALRERLLVVDGATGTHFQAQQLTAADFGGAHLEGCNEVLVRTRPDLVRDFHRQHLATGVDAVETNTFGGAPWVLAEYGLAGECRQLNETAARLAREACDDAATDGRPRFVLGSIGPGTRSPTLSLGKDPATTPDFIDVATMEAGYAEQVRGLLAGGVDVLCIETVFDLLQAKAAVAACHDVFAETGRRLPIVVLFTVEQDINTMLLGTEPAAAIAALDALPIDVLGMNCATGPADMREHVRTLARHSRLPIMVMPNAGIPSLVDGSTHYPLSPAGLADAHEEFVRDLGVNVVGGCCGTTTAHVAALVARVGDLTPRVRLLDDPTMLRPEHRRTSDGAIGGTGDGAIGGTGGGTSGHGDGEVAPGSGSGATDRATVRDGDPSDGAREPLVVEYRPSLASLYTAVPLRQDTSFLVIGERANANGSRAFRQIVLDEDWDATVELARSQTRQGAHVLDLCVDYVGRDGVPDAAAVIDRWATRSTLPIVLDSTEVDVIEAGLVRLGGRAVINSVNLEDGRDKADRLLSLARRYGAAVIVLAIDEEGQARTADWKVEVCRRIARIAIDDHGLEAHDLVFDCLTFPLGSGQQELRRDAIETIEAIRRVKQAVPGCHTTLGVSNVSFGLSPAARQVLNSVFLAEAVAAGLDQAIVHASKILPLSRVDDEALALARDLVWDRRGAAGTSAAAAQEGEEYDPLRALMAFFDGVSGPTGGGPDIAELPLEQRLARRIVDGNREGLTDDLDEALAAGIPALDIVNDHLLDGMATVGELFGAGEMQLPFVLQSAETMKAAVAHVEPHMAAGESGSSKGRVVLATVKGDVHDIGKNLVDIILRNNGYDTLNIGIKQSVDQILDAAATHEADAVGMSGLLVKSTVVMRDNLEEFNTRGIDTPVLLGGAALTRGYVEQDLRELYGGAVFYCKDAFEGLRVLDEVMAHRRAGVALPEELVGPRHRTTPKRSRPRSEPPRRDAAGRPRSDVRLLAADEVPSPPFWGTRTVRGISIDEVWPLLNEVALFRNQWGFSPGGRSPADYQQFLDEQARPVLREWVARATAEQLLTPEVVYGYLPANSDGDEVVVWSPDAPGRVELARFAFPRQDRGRWLCIADFLAPIGEGHAGPDGVDVLGAHCVTVGSRISRVAAELFAEDRYQDYLYAHGFGVEMAEALAELWHARIRDELGIADDDGDTPQDLFRQQYRGSRYSFGYAACPDLEMQDALDTLLDFSSVGVEVTDEHMLHPEQSTSAIVVHHPEASYFNAR